MAEKRKIATKMESQQKRRFGRLNMADRLQRTLSRLKSTFTRHANLLLPCFRRSPKPSCPSGAKKKDTPPSSLPSKEELENRPPPRLLTCKEKSATIDVLQYARYSVPATTARKPGEPSTKIQTPYWVIRQRLPKNAIIYEESQVCNVDVTDLMMRNADTLHDEDFKLNQHYKALSAKKSIIEKLPCNSRTRSAVASTHNLSTTGPKFSGRRPKSTLDSITATGHCSSTNTVDGYKTLSTLLLNTDDSKRSSSGYSTLSSDRDSMLYGASCSSTLDKSNCTGATKNIFQETDGYKQLIVSCEANNRYFPDYANL